MFAGTSTAEGGLLRGKGLLSMCREAPAGSELPTKKGRKKERYRKTLQSQRGFSSRL